MFRRKPEPFVPEPELTAEEREAKRLADLDCWRFSNPVRTYVATFKDGTSREIRCYYHDHNGEWTRFWAWQTEGWSGPWDSKVCVLKCRTVDLLSIELKAPLPKALRVDV